jgi:hypothetical protein
LPYGVPGEFREGRRDMKIQPQTLKTHPEITGFRAKATRKYEKLPHNHAKAFPSYQKGNFRCSFSLKILCFGITF